MILSLAIPAIGALLIGAGVGCYVWLFKSEPFDFLDGLTIGSDDEEVPE